MFNVEMLKVLRCPWCVTRPDGTKGTLATGELELKGESAAPTGLECKQCGRLYSIRDGIPNLIVEEAVLPGKK